ncbi:MAG TPA: glycosyltransferase family 2 protein [Thermoanaerobaculia bacterium]|nr:glycosyltransferase family 2 protein [Thermoanaerobaculia bacterium]
MTVQSAPRTAPSPSSDALELSIVMPCLNEAETLAVCITKARAFLARHGIAGEVVVADNGSTDGSQALAWKNGARVVDVAEKGYGSALQAGIAAARGRFIIMGDSDDSYDFSALDPLVDKLREGYDLVMGNRFRGGIRRHAMPPLHRYLGNPVLSGIGRLFFRSPVRDFHCGLRGFTKEAYERMNVRTTGMEFASELVVKATLLKMRITEVPVTLSPDGRSRPPHLRSWRDGWRHVRFLLLYSPRWLFLYPGAALMIAGLVFGAWLLPKPRPVGPFTLDVHSLLYAAAAVLIGYQAVLFAFFTKFFAVGAGLLPDDPRLKKFTRFFTLEAGLLVGAVLAIVGLGGSVYAVMIWEARSFGRMIPSAMLRLVIPSMTAMTLGFETILASFFLSVLAMHRK